jgi:hypothetical protein
LRDRIRTHLAGLATLALTAAFIAPVPAAAVVAAPKVVIIVGPTGAVTSSYRSQGDDIAAAATAAGADVVKVYSPNATWPNVKSAVNGANIIVYLGHGNGYPNPYNSSLYTDRNDGWGLNISTTGGDSDSTNMIYCGEGPLTGQGYSSWASPQKTYCSGGPITPAPGFVMIYSDACYTPGASEPGNPSPTYSVALQRVSYFSRPVLQSLGASGYFATDHGAAVIVSALLSQPGTTYGDIYSAYQPSGTLTRSDHLLVPGASAWLTDASSGIDYSYAFAGDPTATFGSSTAAVPDPPAATYHALAAPTRIVDSRIGLGLSTHLAMGVPQSFQVAGLAGVPAGATGVTGNLTVTNQTGLGYVSLTTSSQSLPSTSTLNFPVGDNRANGVTTPLSGDGALWAVYRSKPGTTADLVFDLTGYFTP